MKTAQKLSAAFGAASVASALAGAVLYYVSLVSRFDVTIGHFSPGSAVTGFTVCLIASCVLAVVSGAVLTGRVGISGGGAYSKSVAGTFVLLGALLMSDGVLGLAEVLPTFADSGFGKEHIIALATPVFAIIASVYFILISGGEKTAHTRSVLSVAAVAWALLSTLSVYFEAGRPINSPIKALLLTLSLSNMLFITEDARFLFHTQKAALYRAIAALCVSFGTVIALPGLIISISAAVGISSSHSGIIDAMNFSLMDSAVALMIPICAAARLLTFNSCCTGYVRPKHDRVDDAGSSGDSAPEEK